MYAVNPECFLGLDDGRVEQINFSLAYMCEYSYYNGVFCCRFWDLRSGNCINSVQLSCSATSVELSRDRTVLTVTHGKSISFFNANR